MRYNSRTSTNDNLLTTVVAADGSTRAARLATEDESLLLSQGRPVGCLPGVRITQELMLDIDWGRYVSACRRYGSREDNRSTIPDG